MRIYLVLMFPIVCCAASLAADLSQFEHHAAIEIALFAAEPDVVDPVALDFAADGSCYVVEMRDYPYGFGKDRRGGGTVRLLRDTDQDGRADQSIVFAEDLSFPTSVAAWRTGVLVIAPPQVIYLEDTDGDDRADVRKVVIDGLTRGVTDSNANSLRFGFDNRMHLANGGNSGSVIIPGSNAAPLSLGRADLSADFEIGELSKTRSTGGGFGLVFDPWDNRFTTYNIDYLQQQILPIGILESRPELPRWDVTHNISDHGSSARIFPIVEAVTRVNHPEQAGHFSSAGGMGLVPTGSFCRALENSIFVCDVVCNLVHRDVLYEKGPIFGARRAPEETDREFIASRDPAFRPVGLEHGPDGALYLIDMHRAVIEHPDYIPAKLLKSMDVRAGDDQGRIYRIVPREPTSPQAQLLSRLGETALVGSLSHANPWVRRTAQRLLWEGRSASTARTVRDNGLSATRPEARVRSLWLLEGMRQLKETDVVAALQDEAHGVRQNALRLVARHAFQWPTATEFAVERLDDPHAHVRFWAALAAQEVGTPQKLNRLQAMLKRDQEHEWSRRAVYIGAKGATLPLLDAIARDPSWAPLTADRELILTELASIVAAGLTREDHEEFVSWLQTSSQTSPEPTQLSILRGLHAGWQRRAENRLPPAQLKPLLDGWPSASRALDLALFDLYRQADLFAPTTLTQRLETATRVVEQSNAAISERLSAIEILARLPGDAAVNRLVELLSSNEPAQLQQAALDALQHRREPRTGKAIVQAWSRLRPVNRAKAIQILLSRRSFQADLLAAVEQSQIDVGELNLDLEQRRTLLRWSTPAIAARAKRFWGDEEYSNRKQIVQEWLARLPTQGNRVEGQKLFQQHCANCHQVGQLGHRVGPELTSQSHRSVEDLLSHILDPNMAINPNYVACVVETVEGEVMQGLLTADDAVGVTLVEAGGRRTTIPRERIETMQTLKTSLMPEGLEKQLSPQDFRSLIAFLQQK